MKYISVFLLLFIINNNCRNELLEGNKISGQTGFVNKVLEASVKKALIFGITGQDGSYLAEFLLKKGYEVHGVKRRSSSLNTQRIDHLYLDRHSPWRSNLSLHYGDLTDSLSVIRLIKEINPCEIYNLAAQSHVKVSFETPVYTANCDAVGTLRILEAIRILDLAKKVRYYQASTSELFGNLIENPQKESTPFYPRSPYGVSKLYAHWITINYREAYNIFACNGILFNHESERRGATFVTRKIAHAIAQIYKGAQDVLYLGNLNSKRDWGYAPEYVEAMWLMLQQEKPDDFIIATGETHSVREFVEYAFHEVGIDIKWEGQGLDEVGSDVETGKIIVKIDKRYFRPSDVSYLLGDPSKANKTLGWKSRTKFKDLVSKMVRHEIDLISKSVEV